MPGIGSAVKEQQAKAQPGGDIVSRIGQGIDNIKQGIGQAVEDVGQGIDRFFNPPKPEDFSFGPITVIPAQPPPGGFVVDSSDPDAQALQDRLNDPETSAQERIQIQRGLMRRDELKNQLPSLADAIGGVSVDDINFAVDRAFNGDQDSYMAFIERFGPQVIGLDPNRLVSLAAQFMQGQQLEASGDANGAEQVFGAIGNTFEEIRAQQEGEQSRQDLVTELERVRGDIQDNLGDTLDPSSNELLQRLESFASGDVQALPDEVVAARLQEMDRLIARTFATQNIQAATNTSVSGTAGGAFATQLAEQNRQRALEAQIGARNEAFQFQQQFNAQFQAQFARASTFARSDAEARRIQATSILANFDQSLAALRAGNTFSPIDFGDAGLVLGAVQEALNASNALEAETNPSIGQTIDNIVSGFLQGLGVLGIRAETGFIGGNFFGG